MGAGCIEALEHSISSEIYEPKRNKCAVELTAHALEALDGEPSTFTDVVGTELMQHACDGDRVREHPRHLPHASIVVDGFELSRIEKSIPIGHVDDEIIILRSGIREFGEESPRMQVMIVLVDLPEGVADLQVCLEVIHPVLFRAVYWDSAVGAFKV